MQHMLQEYSIEYEYPNYVVKYSVSCLFWNFLLHKIFIFYRIFLKHILHVYPPLRERRIQWTSVIRNTLGQENLFLITGCSL